ncbi:MAG: hypothetical protein O3C43_22320 [Verrucomicrobia bacterium]|nr:hypothetical protein [Verrucomicrobiota bacterium]MDA1069228.1 hypothetical protein [Verrucomicrobiota bacterium]
MHAYALRTPWILALAILFLTISLQGANRILIKAVASEEYVKQRALDDEKKIQTYNFYEGRFFGGNSKDRSLERFTFMDIIQDMAMHLQKQGYYNSPVVGEADLLIVVHYGATDYEESFFDLMGYTSFEDMGYSDDMDASAMAGFQSNLSFMDTMNRANDQSRYGKSRLLGMEEAYMQSTPSWEREDLEWQLTESRYFVILMAYDMPLLKQGETKLLWSTRYSIRAIGQSFDQAIKDMNLVAADYFGKNLKGLNKTRVTDNSHVEFGEIEVIGEERE